MNLTKLFETQKVLDQRIIQQHGLEGQDLLPQKILALQVELGECANEWRGFKFWKVDVKPNTKCPDCKGTGFDHCLGVAYRDTPCGHCNGYPETVNPLLEEYVDCLHFILSIGLELKQERVEIFPYNYHNVAIQFSELFADINRISEAVNISSKFNMEDSYFDTFCEFIGLGKMLGFTWEQIESAYFTKNHINHTRQDTGY